MKEIYLQNLKHIFFVGVGGISMSGLAKIMLSMGKKISGSDNKSSHITYELQKIGVKYYKNHSKRHITKDIDLVVYTDAVNQLNCELVRAKQLGICTVDRTNFLRAVSNHYKDIIAISGAHGKTTTTCMLTEIFENSKLNFTSHIGGESQNLLNSVRIRGDDLFLTEACEYKKNFLKLFPTTSAILNIDYDHPESYKDFGDLIQSFETFANQTKDTIIIHEKYKSLLDIKNKKIITFGRQHGDFTYNNFRRNKDKKIVFSCYKNGEFWSKIRLNSYNKYDILNALCCIAIADHYNIDKNVIIQSLLNFRGTKRRFEYKGELNGASCFIDYAHHPTEIENCLQNVKNTFKKQIICVFQPHTYSRTKKLLSLFVSSLCGVQQLIIVPTYPAREKRSAGTNAKKLYEIIKKINHNTKYCTTFNSCLKYLKKITNKDKIILIVGAGNVCEIGDMLNK